MKVCRTIHEFRTARRALTGSLGFVPTMGYLHEGHMALIRESIQENDHTAASIFVNPTQFNNPDDLTAYPRAESRDLAILREAGVELVLIPSPETMYPADFQTYITVEKVSQGLEGAHRPGHFRGVATVVAKLFNIVQPDTAYFGQKDAQQVAVIRQMVRDLNIPVEITTCPIVREADGLAMSSRNANLSKTERAAATILYRALSAAQTAYQQDNEQNPEALRMIMQEVLNTADNIEVDYVSVADAKTLEELTTPTNRPILLSMAVTIGSTRLIDNMTLDT